ncbi:helix-turn-helix domain-containing protein [Emticicia sp.]|uniref:helix-turn-helix domain-containing protein n=1 Tax=Emticicia sp. TaxID=1930953 RepID=UPI00375173F7
MSKIGERIKELRAGFSQDEFGKKFGVTSVTISAIEKGKQNPGWDLAELICDEFGVSLDWLRGKTEIRTPATENIEQEPKVDYKLMNEVADLHRTVIGLQNKLLNKQTTELESLKNGGSAVAKP